MDAGFSERQVCCLPSLLSQLAQSFPSLRWMAPARQQLSGVLPRQPNAVELARNRGFVKPSFSVITPALSHLASLSACPFRINVVNGGKKENPTSATGRRQAARSPASLLSTQKQPS